MILKLHGLRNRGPVETTAEKSAVDFNLDENEFHRPVNVRVILQDNGDIVDGKVSIATMSRKTCDRCTEEFDRTHLIDLDLIFIPEQHRDWTSMDDAVFYHPDNPVVDITNNIHDALMLDSPLKILCKEDCRGICPGCGNDLNKSECSCSSKPADPRFAALEELKNKLQN